MTENKWKKLTVKKYEYYATKYPMYKKTSKFLVKIANIKKGMIIVDLACGTGITTREILKKLGTSGKVIGIDSSKEMLNVAKKKNKQKNVSFFQSKAEKINKIIKEKVDLVLCNSAFWQTNMNKTLIGIKKILKNDGKFIFNLPSQYYKFTKGPKETLFSPIMQQIATNIYRLKPKKKKLKLLDFETIIKILKNNCFKIVSYKTFEFKKTAKDVYEFLKIPIMTEKTFLSLKYSEKMKILDRAYKEVDKSRKFVRKWMYFVAKKSATH